MDWQGVGVDAKPEGVGGVDSLDGASVESGGKSTPLGGSTSSAALLALTLAISTGSSWRRSPSLECFLNSANSCATGMGGGRKDEPGDGNGVSLEDAIEGYNMFELQVNTKFEAISSLFSA